MQVAVHNFFCNNFLFPLIFHLLDRAVDPHSFLRIRIQLFFSMRIRIQMRIRIMSQPYKICKKFPYEVLKKTKKIAQKLKTMELKYNY